MLEPDTSADAGNPSAAEIPCASRSDAPCCPTDTESAGAQKPSRREFIAEAAAIGAGVTLSSEPAGAQSPGRSDRHGPGQGGEVPVMLRLNGRDITLTIEPRVSLLDAIRERAGLTGTKKGCDHGQCGACTVLIGGRRVLSCLSLAIMHAGQEITTIEGLSDGAALHPMQAAFVAHDGFQCGFCTPGQIMSAVGLVNEGHARTEPEIKEQMSGNICRCGAYTNIVAAIREVMEGRADATL